MAFNAVSGADTTTLNSVDSIDGGAGIDTLNIEVKKDGATANDFNGDIAGTIKNIEIININNTAAASAAPVDASKFDAALQQINQIGQAAKVTGLAATATAGFNGVENTTLEVDAAATATSASLNLTAVKGAPSNVVTATVKGTALSSVNVAGTIVKADATVVTAPLLELGVTGSATATSFALNTSVATKLTLTAPKVVTFDASSSTGGVTFDGLTQVQTITTGVGADVVSTTFNTEAGKNVSISTGAGIDTINVKTTGLGLTTVDAGAGDDTINVTKVTGNKLNIQAGEGNDIVKVVSGTIATTDVINGGDGIDTISLVGKTTYVADDYIVFNKVLTNFETLQLTTDAGILDLSKLAANYTTVDLFAGSTAQKVGTQALIANGALTAEANGVVFNTAGDNTTGVKTYAGSLNITEKAAGSVSAFADVLNLTVAQVSDNDGFVDNTVVTLLGQTQTANVTLSAVLDNKADLDVTNDVLETSSVSVTTATGAAVANSGLVNLTLSGNGSATVINGATTKLVNVDASALNSADIKGVATAGLTYTSDNAAVETIKLGAGIDVVKLNASKFGAVDIVQGLNLVLDTAGTALAATSDKLIVSSAAVTFTKFTTAQTDFDLAIKDAAAAVGDNLVFQFGGNTFVYQDVGTVGLIDAADTLVQITGLVNLDALILSVNVGV